MQEFVIERHIPGVHLLTEEQVREGSLKSLEALRELGPEIQWLRSYITEDKIYCCISRLTKRSSAHMHGSRGSPPIASPRCDG